MKKLFCRGILLGLLLCLFSVAVHGGSGSCGNSASWRLENGTLTIFGSGDMTDYEEIKDVPWYNEREQIEKVVIEEGITHAGKWCLYGLDSMTELQLPSTLKNAETAFVHECGALETLILPDGMEQLGYMSVSGCDSLRYIYIPASLVELDDEVFVDLPALETFEIASGHPFLSCENGMLLNWNSGLLYSGAGASGTVTIPQGIHTIMGQAFMCNPRITSVRVSEGVTNIEGMSFYRCENLTEAYLPQSLQDFGMYTFNRSESLAAVYYAGSHSQWNAVEKHGADSDESLPVVEGMLVFNTPVPTDAQSGMTVVTGDDTTGTYEYDDMQLLDSGVCGDGLEWEVVAWYSEGVQYSCDLYIYGTGDMTDYNGFTTAPWSEYTDIQEVVVEEGVTSIGAYAFKNLPKLEILVLPISIARIGEEIATGSDLLSMVFYDGTQEGWEIIDFAGGNRSWVDLVYCYVPAEDVYAPVDNSFMNGNAAETPGLVSAGDVPAVQTQTQSQTVTAEPESGGISGSMVLVIVAIVVVLIAIVVSITVIVIATNRNKQIVAQMAQMNQNNQTPPPPPVETPTYGYSQNSRYDPYSQYHRDEEK